MASFRQTSQPWFRSWPDWPFHSFKASRSGDQRILSSSGTSCDGLWSSKIVKRSVRSSKSACSCNKLVESTDSSVHKKACFLPGLVVPSFGYDWIAIPGNGKYILKRGKWKVERKEEREIHLLFFPGRRIRFAWNTISSSSLPPPPNQTFRNFRASKSIDRRF